MSQRSGGGVGLIGMLFLLFVGLKLTGYIDWSWWWVTSPLWLTFVVCFILVGITEAAKARKKRDGL